jgi:hypothetical protein
MPHDITLLATVPATLSRASFGRSLRRDELLTQPLTQVASVDPMDQLLGKARHMRMSLRGSGRLICSVPGEQKEDGLMSFPRFLPASYRIYDHPSPLCRSNGSCTF